MNPLILFYFLAFAASVASPAPVVVAITGDIDGPTMTGGLD